MFCSFETFLRNWDKQRTQILRIFFTCFDHFSEGASGHAQEKNHNLFPVIVSYMSEKKSEKVRTKYCTNI